MSYVTLKELLKTAEEQKYAVGAFNIFNYETARAVIEQCEESKSPVIIQTSVKTVLQWDMQKMMDYLLPLAKKAAVPVAIHLDHCTDVNVAKKAVDAGWSSIMIDGSHHSLDENIAMTNEIIKYVKGKNVSVEGELGAIVGVEDDIVVNDGDGSLADVKSSIKYTSDTGIDAFAPAVGTAHGVYKGEPKLDFERFAEIKAAVSAPLVVHGGTGLSTETFRKFVELGASKINVSTAIKIAYLTATNEAAQKEKDPLKHDAYVFGQVKKAVSEFLEIFGSKDRA